MVGESIFLRVAGASTVGETGIESANRAAAMRDREALQPGATRLRHAPCTARTKTVAERNRDAETIGVEWRDPPRD